MKDKPERIKVEVERVIYGKRDLVYGGWHYRKEALGSYETTGEDYEQVEREARRRYPLATWVRLFVVGQLGEWEWLSSTNMI